MARLKMRVAKKAATTFWREYPLIARKQVETAIALLTNAGLHGIAKRCERQPASRFRSKPTVVSGSGSFGGKLNAAPIAGSWRRKVRRK